MLDSDRSTTRPKAATMMSGHSPFPSLAALAAAGTLLLATPAWAQAPVPVPTPTAPPRDWRGAEPADPDLVELPLWEVGVGGFGGYVPDYPGSDEGQPRGLGAPYLIYRGEVFRFGDGSIASVVPVETQRVKLGLSFDAAFNSDSDDNEARQGLPDLDFLLGAGPELEIRLLRRRYRGDETARLDLALQARAVISTDFADVERRGFVFQPRLRLERRNFRRSGVDLFTSIGPIWATERLHDYFYEVDAAFATASRPAFEASGGYFGTEVFFGAGTELSDRWSLFVGSQIGVYGASANEDSPLFKSNFGVSGFLGLAWSFWHSDAKVLRPRERQR